MVALQILVLPVWVRVLVRQHEERSLTDSQTPFFLHIRSAPSPHPSPPPETHANSIAHSQSLRLYALNSLINKLFRNLHQPSRYPPATLNQASPHSFLFFVQIVSNPVPHRPDASFAHPPPPLRTVPAPSLRTAPPLPHICPKHSVLPSLHSAIKPPQPQASTAPCSPPLFRETEKVRAEQLSSSAHTHLYLLACPSSQNSGDGYTPSSTSRASLFTTPARSSGYVTPNHAAVVSSTFTLALPVSIR